ncbi:acyl-CoA N-acyltransferase [Xylariaceae sp. FL0662B]|nr:acyl-CoA N-acyltransferase [Xylariaceae sp. FL0662B]
MSATGATNQSSGAISITIRSAIASEAAVIAGIGARAAPLQYDGSLSTRSGDNMSEAWTEPMVSGLIRSQKKAILVALDQARKIIGFALLSRDDMCPFYNDGTHVGKWVAIDGLYVDPSKHRGGVRSRLLDAVCHMASDEGFLRAWLIVYHANKAACHLYGRKNFQCVQTTGEREEQQLVMVKKL